MSATSVAALLDSYNHAIASKSAAVAGEVGSAR
jgi:hypothetical protein